MKKKRTYTLEENIIKDLENTSERSNINKSRIIELALSSYIEPNVDELSLVESKKVLFSVMDDIARLTKLRDELYQVLENE